ncbi:hypothetical protein L1987_66267 [Smallanthus sonchifolius]|uniref:Uncharacterized protein n=1 Tax=Smallanthus sonchifolius TaxID=185202 RepID=A0ACB9BWU2_9ASTR|nr:hypothetical protein L1987_66267 [Smallanthus sonchifolius]
MQVPDVGMGVSPEAEVTEPLMETTNGQGRIDVDPVIGANQEYVSMEVYLMQQFNLNGVANLSEVEKVPFVGRDKNKRKKFKRTNIVGRPNVEEFSSNERPSKEKRCSGEDPFGIDQFIWAQDLNKNPSESETQKDNSGATFRTGAPQVCNFEVTMAVSGKCRDDEIHANAEEGATGVFLPVSYNGSGDRGFDKGDLGVDVNQEVGKTVSFGLRVGAQLQNFQDMVRESVQQEGLQLGKQ